MAVWVLRWETHISSCEDLKKKGNYVYAIEGNWTEDELDIENWNSDDRNLAYFGHLNNTTENNSKIVAHVSTGRLETKQCLNITYCGTDVKGKFKQVNYIVSASQPEVNANKPGPPEQKVSSVTAKI
ncbi:hypothetical protein GN956_G26816, partial [Arapaima gigas]